MILSWQNLPELPIFICLFILSLFISSNKSGGGCKIQGKCHSTWMLYLHISEFQENEPHLITSIAAMEGQATQGKMRDLRWTAQVSVTAHDGKSNTHITFDPLLQVEMPANFPVMHTKSHALFWKIRPEIPQSHSDGDFSLSQTTLLFHVTCT